MNSPDNTNKLASSSNSANNASPETSGDCYIFSIRREYDHELNEIDKDKETAAQSPDKENVQPSSVNGAAPSSVPQSVSQKTAGKKRRKKSSFKAKPKGKMQGTQTYVKKKSTNANRQKRKAAADADATAAAQKAKMDEAYNELDGLKFSQEDQRRLISDYYLQALLAPPPEKWRGEGGTISDVIEGLRLRDSQRRLVENVLIETHHQLLHGLEYDPSRQSAPGKHFIEDVSKEQQLVADYREQGRSYTETTMLINRWCFRNGRPTVRRSAVRTCEQHMTHQNVSIEKRPQGTTDETSKWAQCRYRWVTQLLIRLGYHDTDQNNLPDGALKLDDLRDNHGILPDCFNPEKLTKLNLCAIAWWDETHKDCFIGSFREGQSSGVQFACNDAGSYDPNGNFRDGKEALQVKYSKEVRLSLRIAVAKNALGEEEGRRISPFNYTECNIVTIKDEQELIDQEIARVRRLNPETAKQWLANPDATAVEVLYFEDELAKVPGVAERKANLLKDQSINNIGKLRALGEQTVENEAQIKQIVKYCNGISKAGLMKMIAACQGAIPGSRPPIASYVNEANPYKAKFGDKIDQWGVPAWKREIRKTTALSGVKCITELIEHIAIESQQCFSDTEYYNSYHWYHDALSQLTANETIEYMKNTNIPGEGNIKIFDRWIKPELGLNDKFGKRWMGRLIGNSPELMPLDNSCNQDVHESVRRHVVMSLSVCGNVADNDPRRFSTSTPHLKN
jgi:hypothetical protein